MFVLVYKYSEFCVNIPLGRSSRLTFWAVLYSGLHYDVCVCVKRPDRLWGPPGLVFIVYQGSLPGVNLPGREVNHSPSSCAEVKNATPVCLHGVDRKNLTYKYIRTYVHK